MTPLPNHWPALVAGARVAYVPECDQRAYAAHGGVVRFYPSTRWVSARGAWDWTVFTENERAGQGDRRLPDADAAALWATRPEGVK